MKQINITYAKGTGFDPFFDHIRSVTLDDAPFAGGGFGDIYNARSFNGGQQSRLHQVIKVFKPSTIGKDEHSWKTITRLQEKLIDEIALNAIDGQDFLNQYPALIAMPQFVFEGTMDGRKVRGYATNNLNDLGLVSFDKVIDEEDSEYIDEFAEKDMEWRYTMAYHLVRGFNLLYKLHFLHADISSDNIFISMTQPTCAILDFDSGAIVETMDDNPSTFGKFQPWLAPEIGFQLKSGKSAGGNTLVAINSFTDAWSVANAILSILTTMQAYYINDLSENSLRHYVSHYTWPRINTSDPIFNKENEEGYEYFVEYFEAMLPDELKREFVATFSKGVFTPSLRTSYNRWERILRKLVPGLPIPSIPTPPKPTPPTPKPPIPTPIPNPLPKPNKKELENYINALILDVVNGDENLKHHEFFINDMAQKAGLNGKEIMAELKDFVELYKDCIADKVITKFEYSNLLAQGEMAMVTEDTINKILKPFKRV
jgi:serine/threonine protein kinase